MSELILVRHGQASFLTDNYDRLSQTGIEQSRQLGLYWSRMKVKADEVYTGQLERQRHTAQIIGECYREAGLDWPEPAIIPELDECHLDSLIKTHMSALVMKYEHVRDLAYELGSAETDEQRIKLYQKAFEAVMDLWIREEIAFDEIEPWAAFEQRVVNGVKRMTYGKNSGVRIVAFTSGGPSAVAIKHVTGVTTPVSLNFMWTKRNCALTEFLFTNGRMTLSSFNSVPHLHDPALWTYR
jgi:broad specificity phosphatase PhoE